MTLQGAFVLSCLLVITGIITVITKRNVIAMLVGIELIFNAANINFVAFNQHWQAKGIDGQLYALFLLAIIAAEIAIALAILLKTVRAYGTTNIDELNQLKD